jgi:hypothetical protein
VTRAELIARYRESAKSFRLQDIEGNDITPEQAADRELARLATKTKTVSKENTMPVKKTASKSPDLAASAVDVHVKAALRRARAEEGDGGEPCEFCGGSGRKPSQEQIENDQQRQVDDDRGRGKALAELARKIAARDGVGYPTALKRAGKERPDLLKQYQGGR